MNRIRFGRVYTIVTVSFVVLVTGVCSTISESDSLQFDSFDDADLDNDELLTDYTDLVEARALHGSGTEDDVKFYCLSPRSQSLVRVYQNDANLTSKIDVTKPIGFLAHGWMDRFFTTILYSNGRGWLLAPIEDWVQYVDTNACGVDWSPLADTEYISAALKNTHIAAYWLAKFIVFLNQSGIPYANVTIAGHSLGSHVAGFTGKNVELWASQQLGTIFGLDPAGPLFTFPLYAPPQNLLQPSDANFVQVIHTSAFTYGVGLGTHTGDASFTANGGVAQPKCLIETVQTNSLPFLCSHFRAVQYFRSSLDPRHRFVGRACPKRAGGLLGLLGIWKKQCASQPITDLFGVHTNRTRGKFDLKTTGTPPFCIDC